MAVRCLRSKLSERIFTHVLKDARIMSHRPVKGIPWLASEGSKKIAPLARHYAIGSTMPIKNLPFQSFKSTKVPESMPFGFVPAAKNVLLYNDVANLSSSFKGKSGPILIHGRRNFSSCPDIRKMDSGNKGSRTRGTEKIYAVKPDRSMSRAELIKKIIKVYGPVYYLATLSALYYTVWDTLFSSPFLFVFTVGGHIFCFLYILLAVLG